MNNNNKSKYNWSNFEQIDSILKSKSNNNQHNDTQTLYTSESFKSGKLVEIQDRGINDDLSIPVKKGPLMTMSQRIEKIEEERKKKENTDESRTTSMLKSLILGS